MQKEKKRKAWNRASSFERKEPINKQPTNQAIQHKAHEQKKQRICRTPPKLNISKSFLLSQQTTLELNDTVSYNINLFQQTYLARHLYFLVH